MTHIENPSRMTIEKANKDFYPNSYVMVNCELERGSVIAGKVVAFSSLERKGALVDYAWSLSANPASGEVTIEDTIDLLDGGTMWVELHSVEAK